MPHRKKNSIRRRLRLCDSMHYIVLCVVNIAKNKCKINRHFYCSVSNTLYICIVIIYLNNLNTFKMSNTTTAPKSAQNSKAAKAILMQATVKYSKVIQLILLNTISMKHVADMLDTNVAYVQSNIASVLTAKKRNAIFTFQHCSDLQAVIITAQFAKLNTKYASALQAKVNLQLAATKK